MNKVDADERGLIVECTNCHQRNRATFGRLNEPFRCSKCQTQLALPTEPVEIASERIFKAVVREAVMPVLVDFWAPWCGPCKMIAPELAKVASSHEGHWLICKANIDVLQGIATDYNVSSIPTMTIFKKGREVARQSGAMGAAAIQRFMNNSPA